MSSVPAGSDSSRFVSLSDEEAVKEIVRTTILNLWKVVETLMIWQLLQVQAVDLHREWQTKR